MLNYRNKPYAALSALAAAGVLAICGPAAASAAAPAARPGFSGTEHFEILGTSPSSPRASMIATGAFTAGGVHVGVNNGKAVFPGGTFKMKVHVGHSKRSFSRKTCLFRVSERGTYKISGGTGKYAGITGSGKFAGSVLAVFARDSRGKCAMNSRPAAWQFAATLHGPVKR
jgi:hypothetical protein